MTSTEQLVAELRLLTRQAMADPAVDRPRIVKELRYSAELLDGWKDFLQEMYKEAGYQ